MSIRAKSAIASLVEANAANLFLQLISRRDERGSMPIICNRSVAAGPSGSAPGGSRSRAQENRGTPRRSK